MIFEEWSDAEIVMVAIALNSGATVKGEGVAQVEADRLNERLYYWIGKELSRREVHPHELLRMLVGRAVTAVRKEKPNVSSG